MNKQRIFGLLTLAGLVAVLCGATQPAGQPVNPSGSARIATTWEETMFRQQVLDSSMIRRGRNNDVIEMWVSPSLSIAQIQTKLDSLKPTGTTLTGGGILYLMPGTYTMTTTTSLRIPSNVRVIGVCSGDSGNGYATVRLNSSTTAQSVFYFSNGADNISIENIRFDGMITDAWTTTVTKTKFGIRFATTVGTNVGITIKNCTFDNFTSPIHFDAGSNASNVKIIDNKITLQQDDPESPAYGIKFDSATNAYDVLIKGNLFTGYSPNYDGDAGDGDPAGTVMGIDCWAKNVQIIDNIFDGMGKGSISYPYGGIGIYIGGKFTVVSNNIFREVVGDNISVRGRFATVVGNNIYHSWDQGIVVEDVANANCIVQGNTVDSCGTGAIRVLNASGVQILGNFANICGVRPSLGTTGNPRTYRALISITNLDDSNDDTISDVSVIGNHLRSDERTTRFAVLIDSCAGGVTYSDQDTVYNIIVKDNLVHYSEFDTAYGGVWFPSAVINYYTDGFPLETMAHKYSGSVTGVPGDGLTDRYAIQRWINRLNAVNSGSNISNPNYGGMFGIISAGIFEVGKVCTLKSNVHIVGSPGVTFKAMTDSISRIVGGTNLGWGRWVGLIKATGDTSWSIKGIRFDGNVTDGVVAKQDTTIDPQSADYISERSIAIVVADNNLNGEISDCEFVDWNHSIWVGSGSSTGPDNKMIKIHNNHFEPQSFFGKHNSGGVDANTDYWNGTTVITINTYTSGDTTRGVMFYDNTVQDNGIKVMPKCPTTATLVEYGIPIKFRLLDATLSVGGASAPATIYNSMIRDNLILLSDACKSTYPTRVDSVYTDDTWMENP